ncbi:MAG TPA: hypothetical protein DCE08_00675 [Ruminococcaceae bacterium]|nr:hypothetical protein [Oscillospiraceae bacterium]
MNGKRCFTDIQPDQIVSLNIRLHLQIFVNFLDLHCFPSFAVFVERFDTNTRCFSDISVLF